MTRLCTARSVAHNLQTNKTYATLPFKK